MNTTWILASFAAGLLGGWGLKELYDLTRERFSRTSYPFDWAVELPQLIKTETEQNVRIVYDGFDDQPSERQG